MFAGVLFMRSQFGLVTSSVVSRLSTACVLALGVSACSSDTMRFSDAAFSSPFKTAQAPAPSRDPATTGSLGGYQSPAPMPSSVRSQPLPPPQSTAAMRAPAPAPVAVRAPAAATAVVGSASGWSAQGGTPVVVAQGETLDMISSRYGVPRSALMQANGLSGTTLAPGSTVVIPVYNATASAAPVQAQPPVAAPLPRQTVRNAPAQADARPAPPRPLPANAVAARPAPAPVAAPVARIATPPAIDPKVAAAADAKAKAAADAQAMRESRAKFAAEAKAKAEARKAAAVAAPAAAVTAKPVLAEAKKPAPVAEKTRPVVVASAPAETRVSAVPKSEPTPAPAPVVEPKTTASLPKQEEDSQKADFRWPARGRVIAGYSGKGGNEGINIAVPEGTPIKAAEGGTVAYAGNELKGYGNLVLIRHPNGYVSAYAHNGDLKVKRGDTVKRGQVVAQSGQTGNVSSPQLHFELRKGSSPVDPTPYLNN